MMKIIVKTFLKLTATKTRRLTILATMMIKAFLIPFLKLIIVFTNYKEQHKLYTVGTGRKLNVHKTFIRRPRRLLNVLYTFNLRPVSTG